MNCLDFRRECLIDPNSRDTQFLQHRDACPACAAYLERGEVAEASMREAFEVKVPDGLASRIKLGQVTKVRQRQSQQRWYAVAASVLLLVGGLQFAWFTHQFDSFEQSVLVELNSHSDLLTRQVAMRSDEMAGEFRKAGLTLEQQPANLLGVHYCWVHGVSGLHMVFQGEQGPVRVLILPDRQLAERSDINDGEQRGYISPVERGALVFMGEPGESLQLIEEQVGRSVNWL
ncbi:hypothetical protein BOW53_10880 [Solemya pervernicosa gill symbiont]|uniref:DUF3379 domain-containing protein n=2 Tax=Gammaproteobacteria incertae sedis TaxID=118884 RepID=A0A1T2L3J4_9GAMM|nr:DUF3379 family protein [Candidatus Reidiella endopervernicosa]OOZ39639.1 hypothetical protein BOW53_10880 [Solemya pervernicosa gill symbiont]